MKTIKKALRILLIVFLIAMAFCGVGLTFNFLAPERDRYRNKEIRTEQVDKKEDEEEEEADKT